VQEVVRKKMSSTSDFIVKLELPLTSTMTITKDGYHILEVVIKTHGMTCTVVFVCQSGTTKFEFMRIE
jgi:hypothetical protein